jgi:hypothetical protein
MQLSGFPGHLLSCCFFWLMLSMPASALPEGQEAGASITSSLDWQVFRNANAGKTGSISFYSEGQGRILEKYSDKTERLKSPAGLSLYCVASNHDLSVSIMPPAEAMLNTQLDHTATYRLDDDIFRELPLTSPATVRVYLAEQFNVTEDMPLPFKVMFPRYARALTFNLLKSKKLIVRMKTMTGDILEMEFPTAGLKPVAKESRRLCWW